MRLKNRPGFLSVPLLAILAILIAGVLLVKFLIGHTPLINAQINNKYSVPGESNANTLSDVSQWATHTNSKYNYTIKYPQVLSGKYNYDTNNDLILSRERFISDKIDVTVTVYSKFDTSQLQDETKVGSNSFLHYKDDIDTKGVVIKHNGLYYTIEFSQINYFTETPYFSSSTQFKEVFDLILKNFQFNDQ